MMTKIRGKQRFLTRSRSINKHSKKTYLVNRLQKCTCENAAEWQYSLHQSNEYTVVLQAIPTAVTCTISVNK